ncbi:MAG: putative transcriptional regulator [Rubritepida sp.]|jgi:DNA-binding HxlR family transcriptional regulator|nr:putative transcriptional regulator [Rubritepida sp.]
MASYGQFCPVAKTSELFAERWTPLVLRELCCGPAQFNDLRRRLPLMSKTLLAQRLRDLEQHGVVSITEKPTGPGHIYALTPAGEDFRPIIQALSLWGQRYTRNILQPEDFDPAFLLMSVRGQIPRSAHPTGRFVICFEFRGIPGARVASRRWWFVIAHPEIELCMKNPGYEVDVTISATLETFTRAWMGYIGLADEAARQIAFDGAPQAVERAKALLGLYERPRERRLVYGPAEMVDAQFT